MKERTNYATNDEMRTIYPVMTIFNSKETVDKVIASYRGIKSNVGVGALTKQGSENLLEAIDDMISFDKVGLIDLQLNEEEAIALSNELMKGTRSCNPTAYDEEMKPIIIHITCDEKSAMNKFTGILYSSDRVWIKDELIKDRGVKQSDNIREAL